MVNLKEIFKRKAKKGNCISFPWGASHFSLRLLKLSFEGTEVFNNHREMEHPFTNGHELYFSFSLNVG